MPNSAKRRARTMCSTASMHRSNSSWVAASISSTSAIEKAYAAVSFQYGRPPSEGRS
nr:hypothetical protein [Leifsonia shinshuensis]